MKAIVQVTQMVHINKKLQIYKLDKLINVFHIYKANDSLYTIVCVIRLGETSPPLMKK
jgi:hypothetical protein